MNVKTNSIKTALAAIFAGIALSGPALAHHGRNLPDSGLVYVNPAFNNAIYSYGNVAGAERAVTEPRVTYVDRAFGQAIYGYPRVAPDRTAALEITYVDPAWGQAIFSYEGISEPKGAVEVLPDDTR